MSAFIARAFGTLALAYGATPQASKPRTEWCAVPTTGAPSSHEARMKLATSSWADFRGVYDGFDLVIIPDDVLVTANRSCFERHVKGDDGLWVVETATAEKAAKLGAAAKAAGFKIMYHSATGRSFVTTGGEKLTNVKGLESCGEDGETSVIPVPKHAVPMDIKSVGPQFLGTCCKGIDPVVEAVVKKVSKDELTKNVQELQNFGTRNSYSTEAHDVVAHLKSRAQALGLTTSTFSFQDDMAPNVIAEKKGSTSDLIIVGAHYDSRAINSTDPEVAAPGADDDASGSSAALEIMRVISELDTVKTIRFMWFCGEEQGLLGSRAIAASYAAAGESVHAMVNMDMLGHTLPGQPIQMGFKDRSVSMQLTEFAMNCTATYVGIPTGLSSSCCSDYLGFYEEGYASVGFFENNATASAYPQYHKSEDLLTQVNTEQLTLETKAIVATVAELAGVSEKHQMISV